MKIFFLLLPLTLVSPAPALALGENNLPNAINAQVGSNYFGQSLSLSYSTRLVDHFWAGFGLEYGSFFFGVKAGETFFTFKNDTGHDLNYGMDIHDIAFVSLSWVREEKGMFRWANSLGIGVSHYDMTFRASSRDIYNNDFYEGRKDISAFAVYTELHLVDFYPLNDQLFFSLGIKGNTTFLPSPQKITMTNSDGDDLTYYLETEDGSPIIIPYLELFLTVGRTFN